MTDYYKRLQIPFHSSADEIKKAFRNLSKKYHPDLNVNNPQAEELFKEIQEAYAVLSNPDKKREYDFRLQNYRLARAKRKATGKKIPHIRHFNSPNQKKGQPKINPTFVAGGVIFLLIVTFLITYLENRYDESDTVIHTIDITDEPQKADSLSLIEGFKPTKVFKSTAKESSGGKKNNKN